MPFPATPSPFGLSRRIPPSARRNAGPQFARTPRFRLSQTATLQDRDQEEEDDDIDLIDEDATPSHRVVETAQPQSRNAVHTRRERDVIEDSDDGELLVKGNSAGGDKLNELVDDAIDSSPPENPQSPGLLDAEFEAVFAPVRGVRKRRRISVEGDALSNQGQKRQHELAQSLSPEQQQPKPDASVSPDSRPSLDAEIPEPAVQDSPAMTTRTAVAGASTPGNTKTPFRTRLRFMFSSTQKRPGSQSASKSNMPPPTQPPPSPPERRKPVFVLPRPPSPSGTDGEISAPFSPSSRTLRRRGRPRAGVPGYVHGGMASEVRSWILEVGAKRKQTITTQTPRPPATDSTRRLSADDLGEYLVAARVIRVRQAVLSSSGPLAFIQATPVCGTAAHNIHSDNAMKMLVMGQPRSKPPSRQISTLTSRVEAPAIQAGDCIGIHNGLSWKLELATDLIEAGMSNSSLVQQLQNTSSENEVHATVKEQWLVAMEWDLIRTRHE